MTELATLPRAAVVVEDRYSQVFAQEHVRPAVVADGLAELQVRWPTVPVLFCETRPLAEEWTYRFLAAALAWARDEVAAEQRIAGPDGPGPTPTPSPLRLVPAPSAEAGPSTAEIRAWALTQGLPVSDRGRLRPEIVAAWHDAHPPVG